MKRPILNTLLALSLAASLFLPAGAAGSATAVEAVQALGILTGDGSGMAAHAVALLERIS